MSHIASRSSLLSIIIKSWRCLSVKTGGAPGSFPHLGISPGGWVGKRTKRDEPSRGNGRWAAWRAYVCGEWPPPEGQVERPFSPLTLSRVVVQTHCSHLPTQHAHCQHAESYQPQATLCSR